MTYVTAFTVLESYYVRILSCFGACQSKIAKLLYPAYIQRLYHGYRGGGEFDKMNHAFRRFDTSYECDRQNFHIDFLKLRLLLHCK